MKRFILNLSTVIIISITVQLVQAKPHSKPYQVVTSTYPLYAWARILLKEIPHSSVELLTPSDQDPSVWTPDSSTLSRYQEASLIVLNGAQFEQWLNRVSLPPSRTLETAEGFREQWLHYPQAVTHQHGPEGEHSHEGIDGHTWLDPLSALEQTQEILNRLKQDLPQYRKLLTANAATLKEQLERLHQQWSNFATDLKASTRPVQIWASHPAYQYLARRYQLPITSFDFSPEQPITPEALKALLTQRASLATETHLVLWWEATPTSEVQEALKDLHFSATVLVPPFETKVLNPSVQQGLELPGYIDQFEPVFKALKASLPK